MHIMTAKPRPKPVDTAIFKKVVDLALEAFRENEEYAVLMINRARAIIHKSEVSATRAKAKKRDTS